MSRAQCIVHRQKRILMVKHRHKEEEWWCLPGGRIEEDETPEQAALKITIHNAFPDRGFKP